MHVPHHLCYLFTATRDIKVAQFKHRLQVNELCIGQRKKNSKRSLDRVRMDKQ